MAELKDCQHWEMESKLQFHSCLMLMEHMFAYLKIHNLKVSMQGTYCISLSSGSLSRELIKSEERAVGTTNPQHR